MANRDNPRGFIPYKSENGGEIRCVGPFTVEASNGLICKGDVVQIDIAQGKVQKMESYVSTVDSILGIAAHPVAASAAGDILLYPLDGILYKVQSAGAIAASQVFRIFQVATPAGNATLLKSNMEISVATPKVAFDATNNFAFQVLGAIPGQVGGLDNTLGSENCEVFGRFVSHVGKGRMKIA